MSPAEKCAPLSLSGLDGLVAAQPRLLDPVFPAGAGPDYRVRSVAVRPDRQVLVAGRFTNLGRVRDYGQMRLEADGTVDPALQSPLGPPNLVS